MKKVTLIIIIISNLILADDNFSADLRFGYQKNDNKQESALRLNLNTKTDNYYGFSINATLSSVIGYGDKNQGALPFFDSNGQDYTNMSKLYIKYEISNTQIIVGRQAIESPFADIDGGAMIENSFEAFTIINKDIKDTTITLSQVQKWAGVDAPNTNVFTDINGDKGMQIIGISYEGIKNMTFNAWFYNLDSVSKNYYTDINYENENNTISYGGALQYALQKYDNGDTAKIFGIESHIGIKSIGLEFGLAYNYVDGINADNLFGGGPFFTNEQQNALIGRHSNGNIMLYSVSFDASILGAKGLNLYMSRDKHDNKHLTSENDYVIEYEYNDKINFSLIYSDVTNNPASSFRNIRAFVDYRF